MSEININPNINIQFDEDFNLDINEQELIKNIDFSQLNPEKNTIPYPTNIITASDFLKNKNINMNPFKENPSKENIKTNNIIDNQNNSSKMTNMNMPCVYTGEKGGMKGINHEKIEKIIYETTKNSRIFRKNEEDLASLKQEISSLEKKLENFHKNEILYNQVAQLAKSRIEFLKEQRRFDKIWMHLDMDMFFAAVEIRDDPSLANIPMAVGGMSMISTSNYIARKFGVRSAMPGFIALKLCPQLKLVEPHFYRYKEESRKIMEILEEYDPFIESMGLDEAYIDLTDYCKKNKIYSKDEITNLVLNIKKKILDKTKLTCSCGIACNKTLAKICSDYNKPDGFFFLDYDPKIIEEFVEKLSIRKIPFIGSKTESRLNLLNIFTCKDLVERNVDLFYLSEDSFDFYMKNCLGVGHYEHSEYQEEKSISRSESFFMTGNKEQLFNTLDKLRERIFKDMDKSHILYCKTLTVEIIGLSERKISKCFTNKNGLPSKTSIKAKSVELLTELLEREKKARMIRIKISGLVKENENENKNGIVTLLNNLKTDYKEGILPKKKLLSIKKEKGNNNSESKINLNKYDSQTKSKRNNKKGSKKRSKSAISKIKFKVNKNKRNSFRDILSLISNMKEEIKDE